MTILLTVHGWHHRKHKGVSYRQHHQWIVTRRDSVSETRLKASLLTTYVTNILTVALTRMHKPDLMDVDSVDAHGVPDQ